MNQYARVLAIGYDRTKAHNIDRPLSRGKKRTDGTVALDLSWQALRMFEDHRESEHSQMCSGMSIH